MLNQILFQTGPISLGQHTLQVVYKGNAKTTPLSINGILVQNGTVTPGSSPISTSFPTLSSMGVHKPRIIIGCVIGGLLLAFTGVFILWMRKRRGLQTQPKETDIVEPFH